ncbi:hypothetical protein [Streptomyces cinereoruber]|uniref:hypothetical protein n=1 Tax=Streptomyces cinereoruber TaxID=67260 RepID=UPI003399255D
MAARQNKPASSGTPQETRLDDHIDAPSTTAPGDGPADTTDPTEMASSVSPDKAAAARAGHLTVNAVVPVEAPAEERDTSDDRYEEYEAVRPDGTKVHVKRNVETGETEVA